MSDRASGLRRYTPDGLPVELQGWDLVDIRNQLRTYSPLRLLQLYDLAGQGTLWRDLLGDEIIRRCEPHEYR